MGGAFCRGGILRYNAPMSRSGAIDFHCHLDDPVFDENRWQLIAACFASGFEKLVVVADAYAPRSLELVAEMLDRHEGIDAMAGAHPHQAEQYDAQVEKRLLGFLERPRVRALGEAGLDFHYDFSSRESQARVFARQVAIANELALPLVIHARQAEPQVLEILARERFAPAVVFHCFTGTRADAEEILARGYFLSFSGIITFRKADALRAIVAQTPLERLLSETDSPYLAPEPERGRTNTPLAVERIVRKIAEIKSLEEAELKQRIAENYRRLAR